MDGGHMARDWHRIDEFYGARDTDDPIKARLTHTRFISIFI